MMQLIKSIQLIFLFMLTSVVVLSCSNHVNSGVGGYSDISLNRNSSEYDIKRLNEVESTSNSFWGIPFMKNKESKNKSGFIFRFNGITINKTPAFLPVFTLISSSIILGKVLEPEFGYKKVVQTYGNQSITYVDPNTPNLHW